MVGRLRLFDPSPDEQLSSGYWVLSLDDEELLRQRGSNGILGKLARAIQRQIGAGLDAALNSWINNDSVWVESHESWPRGTRKFRLGHSGRLLPQDHDRVSYKLYIDPTNGSTLLTRDGCIWLANNDPRMKTDDPRVKQLYNQLCRRPPLAA